MDEGCTKAVYTLFKQMFDKQLIYRGNYLVNWDPVHQTAISDDEVEYEEKQGKLYFIRYPLEEGGMITIATTRPETMLADVAVAVSKKDAHLVGKKVILPLQNRKIPIILDDYVDSEFGTGKVKITPAHDPNDYQMAKRHNLPMINMMTPDGRVNEQGGEFEGLTMAKARTAIVEALKKLDLLEKTEEHVHRVGRSYRSKAIIEPYLSKQWFIKMAPFKQRLIDLVKNDEVRLIPPEWKSTYFHWIENLRDWCISRQLYWGHRIPVYYHTHSEKIVCGGTEVPKEVLENPDEWRQDEDVLDTWFSSALWPFSTLGYPQQTKELKQFFPLSILITGHDILFFWVARMLMMSEFVFQKPPFPKVFLHGLIFGKSYWTQNEKGHISYVEEKERREYELGQPIPKGVHTKWEKMSKSKGNIIDPIQIVDEFGADAMRMALCSASTQNKQIDLDLRSFEEFKHFSNKVWNAARFALQNLTDKNAFVLDFDLDFNALELEDKWIMQRAKTTVELFCNGLDECQYEVATKAAYRFFWDELCAYYLELTKPVFFGKRGDSTLKKQKQWILLYALTIALRLLHPLAPFITEEIFSYLKQIPISITSTHPYTKDLIATLQSECLACALFPKLDYDFSSSIESFKKINEMLKFLRHLRASFKINPQDTLDVYMVCSPLQNSYIIELLGKTKPIYYVEALPDFEFASSAKINEVEVAVPLPKEYVEKEKARRKKEKETLEGDLISLKKRLENSAFLQNAPKDVIEQLKRRQKEIEDRLSFLA
jgi:valyl-tRNA synthetase